MAHFYEHATKRGAAVFARMLGTETPAETRIALDTHRAIGDTATLDRAVIAADRAFEHHCQIGSGAKNADSATAAKLTRCVKAEGASAVRYADHKSVTGALSKLSMRVRPGSRQSAGPDRPMRAPDAIAGMVQSARNTACADLRAAIAGFRSARNGSAKDAHKSRIRAILAHWTTDGTIDATIAECAKDAGWRSI